MKFLNTLLSISLFGILLSLGQAQDRPVVVVPQNNLIDVYIDTFAGSNNTAAMKVLENDLKMSGNFNLSSATASNYKVQGQVKQNGLSASLLQRDGTTIFANREFDGDWRAATHKLSDAIVEALTNTPGFASSKIVFVSAHTGNKEIYVMDIDGANIHQLTNDNVLSLSPKFSADSEKIAYTSYKSHFPDVWVMNLVASKRTRVSFFPGLNGQPAFSPDGSQLALILSKDGNPELYTISAAGGNPMRLTRTRGTEASPAWSPDGAQIAFVSDDRGSAQIYTMPVSGGSATRLKTNSLYATEPSWSPDGKKIAYSFRNGGNIQIAMLSLEKQDNTVLTQTSNCESPSWTRNSRHLVYVKDGQLYLLDSLTKQSLQIKNGLSRNSEPNCSK
jgi:TolB protein